jgi:hypothetical protein
MKRKKDLTAAQWKSVPPETARRLKGKVEAMAGEERVKKDAISAR